MRPGPSKPPGRLLLWAASGVLLVSLSCARPGRPPGGPEDRVPPMVVSTWPDTFARVEPTRDPIRIVFSERVSERPTDGRPLEDAVIVSPQTGQVEVKHTRSGLEVSLLGGLKEGLVYRVRVLPTIKDMFNNPMVGPFELVFSTGGEFDSHVLAGVVTDRITGEPLEGIRVEARGFVEEGEEGGPPYVTRSDTAGIYLLRYLPEGSYRIVAYQDVNRNREVDFRELQGEAATRLGLLPPRKDTIVTALALLRPDTTPAQLIRAELQDSVTLRLVFDDFLPPEGRLDAFRISVRAEGEEEIPLAHVLWERELDSLRSIQDSIQAAARLEARADSLQLLADALQDALREFQAAADTLRADSVARSLDAVLMELAPSEPPSTPPARPGGRPGMGAGAGAEAPPPILPEQEVFVILQRPLTPDLSHQVTVAGVRNVNGVLEGGGETSVTWSPPERPPGEGEGTPPDTTGVPPDTARAGRGGVLVPSPPPFPVQRR